MELLGADELRKYVQDTPSPAQQQGLSKFLVDSESPPQIVSVSAL